MWKKIRAVLNRLAVGALIGFGLWSVVGGWATSLLFGSLGGSFSCRTDVELALGRYIAMQVYSAAGGALLFVAGGWLIRRAVTKRRNGTGAALVKVDPETASKVP